MAAGNRRLHPANALASRLRRSPAATVVRLLPPLGTRAASAYAVLILLGGLLPVAVTLAIGALVGAVPAAVGEGLASASGRHMMLALGVLGAVYVARQMHGPFREAVSSVLGYRLESEGAHLVMRACLAPAGIAHLEDPAVADKIRLAEKVGTVGNTRQSVPALAAIASARLAALGSAIILFRFRWWAPLVMLVAWRISRAATARNADLFLRRMEAATPGLRRADYMRDLVVTGTAAKETRIFGLGEWSVGRFTRFWLDGMEDIWRERLALLRILVPAFVSVGLGYAVVLFFASRAAAHGAFGVGTLVVYVQAASGMSGFGYEGDSEWELTTGARPIQHALDLPAAVMRPDTDLRGEGRLGAGAPSAGICLEGVHFTYPGRTGGVFAGLDLEIPAGASLAIVGENGAGKTTLIKLLCRLYDPQQGRIVVDGTDLRALDPAAWRRQIGVIFQDFVHFEMAARDNVAMGAPHLDDEAALSRAAELAGAARIIAALPRGWDTTLSRKYTGGADLSGGEWQRVALARALYAVRGGARLLVLDEPTANLDVRAEAELYERFLEIAAGVTTILVSHRFSTVRKADRICVIEHGGVIEQGTHAELLERGGTYARMFAQQASAYFDEVPGA